MQIATSPNLKNHVSLTTVAVVRAVPHSLRLRDHSTDAEDASEDRTWSAIYGQNGAEIGLRYYHAKASEPGLLQLKVRSWIELRNLELLKANNGRDSVWGTGFLHTDRVARDYRDELREEALDHLARKHGAKFAADLRHLTFKELIIRRPELAGWILHTEPQIRLVVHPARLSGMDESKLIHLGTMRKRDARSVNAEVVFMEDKISVRY